MQSNATGVLNSSQNNVYHINQSVISLEDQQAPPDLRDDYNVNSFRLRAQPQISEIVAADAASAFDESQNSPNRPASIANSSNIQIQSQTLAVANRNHSSVANSTGGLIRDKSHTNYQKRNNQMNSGGLEIITEENRQNLLKRRTSTDDIKEGKRKKSLLKK